MIEQTASYHCIINLYKPVGPSSHDMVHELRKLLGCQKIGHAGTLDPFASGVLVMGVGHGTKILEYLQHQKKTYLMTLQLGWITDTFDCSGKTVEQNEVTVSEADIIRVVQQFVGGYDQVPPQYSAKKIGGKKLYELARKGKIIQMPPRPVEIDAIEVVKIERPDVTVKVICGEGTYMRSLAMDIGYELGCGATALSLQRTKIGNFSIEEAASINEMTTKEEFLTNLLPIDRALPWMKKIFVDDPTVADIRNGKQIYAFFPITEDKDGRNRGQCGVQSDFTFEKQEMLRVCDVGGNLVALAEAEVNGSFVLSLLQRKINRRIATLIKVFGVE